MAATKRVGRQREQLPHCYYEGFLEKRSFEDKASRRLWTCLCGNVLFFYNNTNDNYYVEKLELRGLISLTDDCSRDRNLEAARLILRMEDEEIKITAPSLEARELWKGFISSVVELSVPSSLNLLPGQIHMMRETVETERERLKTLSPTPAAASSSNLYLSLIGDMPACFQPVSRTEAEMILERHSDCGNLLIRPSRDGASLAVTTRQDLNGSVFRHYRVTRKHDGGYAIDVDIPIFCATLHDVINCLVDKTNGTLTPFIMEGPYEESIMFVQANEENGESLQCVPSTPMPPVPVPALPPKPGPERKALMPPLVPSVRTPRTSRSTSTDTPDTRLRSITVTSVPPHAVAQTISEELKLKLEKRRAQ
uniref:Signal transducing adaptor family member 2b n=1 Tax=Salmo trutta TaxID=8032 RepID=A0A674C6M7_SALTR